MKRIIISIAILVVAAAAIVSIVSRGEYPSLFDANVEALGRAETGGKTCYKTFTDDPNDSGIYCGTCESLPGRPSNKSNCYK